MRKSYPLACCSVTPCQLSFGIMYMHFWSSCSHFVWIMTSTPKHFTVHVYGFGQHKCAKVVLWRCCLIVSCLWFVGILCMYVCLSRSGRHCVYSRFVALCIFPRGPCSQLPGLSTFGCHDRQGAYIEFFCFAITNLRAFVCTDLDAFAATEFDHQQVCVAECADVGH